MIMMLKKTITENKSNLNNIIKPGINMNYKFDFFISYSSENSYEIIVPLAREMKKAGITYFLDLEQIQCGESLNDKLTFGITKSKYVLAIITENSIKKPWVRVELNAALHRQISSRQTRLLPVISGTTRQVKQILETMPLLRDLHYLKWRNNPCEIVHTLLNILNK